ncbi:MAG: ABC transporter substrate-binding protein [Deltaproteobacteria bacterium]|nr:ABC transporter substrate-binding protein [Deltaproteobacteria bacterium]
MQTFGSYFRLIVSLSVLLVMSARSGAGAQEKLKFPVGVGTKTVGTHMFWLGVKKGFFDEVGLDVQTILLRGNPITTAALVSESVNLALGSADAVIAAAANGADLLAVGGVVNGLTQAIVAGKNYKSFKDLRGATVGVQALTSGAANVLQKIFKQNGLNYPADYKMLAVGGGSFNLAALTSGQLGATYLVVPLDFTAEQQGFNVLGYFRDYIPNYQLSLLTVKRGWAEKNRGLLVRYLKATVRMHRWLYANKEAAIDFLAKEMPLKPELARRGWEYYTANRIWHPNAEIGLEGLKFAMQIYAEQVKGAPPDPAKYIDQSYLQQAIKELG